MLPRHTKRAILGFVFAGTAILLIAAATRNYFARRALDFRIEQERAAMVPPEPLTHTVRRETRTRTRRFPVTLEPFRRTSLAAEASGRITGTFIETGDSVESGDLLFQIDPTIAQLSTKAAEAALAAAKTRAAETTRRKQEAENLAQSSIIPKTELEAIQAEAEIANADLLRLQTELEQQQEFLKRHQIRAPFPGRINRRLIDTGDSVNISQPVANLVQLNPLKIRFHVSDLEINSFKTGEILPLEIDSHQGEQFTAKIRSVASASDPSSGLFLIECEIENPDEFLRGGLNGHITATITSFENQIFIPAAAIRFSGKQAFVEKHQNGKTILTEIEPGPEIDGFRPVLNGLREGDLLLIR